MERPNNPDGSLRLKRYFYLIRPVLALRWLRLNPGLATPPMDMATLMAECDLPATLQQTILDLIDRKKTLTERGNILATPAETDDMIKAELAHTTRELQAATEPSQLDLNAVADALLTDWTKRCDRRLGGNRS